MDVADDTPPGVSVTVDIGSTLLPKPTGPTKHSSSVVASSMGRVPDAVATGYAPSVPDAACATVPESDDCPLYISQSRLDPDGFQRDRDRVCGGDDHCAFVSICRLTEQIESGMSFIFHYTVTRCSYGQCGIHGVRAALARGAAAQ